MTREERLRYCKVCDNKKHDFQRGLLCQLTDDYATFEDSCPDFVLTPGKKLIRKQKKRTVASDNAVKGSEKLTKKDIFMMSAFALTIIFINRLIIYSGLVSAIYNSLLFLLFALIAFILMSILRDPYRSTIHIFEDLKLRILFIIMLLIIHTLYVYTVYPYFRHPPYYIILFLILSGLSFFAVIFIKLFFNIFRKGKGEDL